MISYQVIVYQDRKGKEPLTDWLNSLKDRRAKRLIALRIQRLAMGNVGDHKVVQGAPGLYELRVDHGPGYRLYFGKVGRQVVVLLAGGSKRTQRADIAKAGRYLEDYRAKR